MADINLSPYTAESEAIARKMRLADVLQQQSMLPIEMPTQAGVHISPLAGLAKMLQAYKGAKKSEQATQEAKDLVEKIGTEAQNWMAGMGGIKGTPNTPEQIYKPDSGDYREMGMMGKELNVNPQGQAIEPAQTGIPDRVRTPQEQQAYLFQGTRNPVSAGLANALLSKNIENEDFQKIIRQAQGQPNVANTAEPTVSNQLVRAITTPPTQGALPQTNVIQGALPQNGLNPNVLAMSGNPRAMELAKFIQTNQPEFGTKSEVFQKPDGTLFERVLGKRGEVIERPLAGTPYEKEPEANRGVTSAIVAAGIDPKSSEGKKIYRELVAKQISHPPAASIKTDIKVGESIAGQVGPMMKDSVAIAEGAVRQVDAANRVIQAVDTNKLTAGPFAGARVTASQLGQVLGVGGKDAAEQLANTRQVIRGLAEMTLQGRSQMKGQGAITESEGLLAEKANSGRIEDLTIPEIKQLAIASERAARFAYAEHQRKLQEMIKNPATTAIAPYYQGPAMPDPISQNIQPVLVDGNPPPGAVRRVR